MVVERLCENATEILQLAIQCTNWSCNMTMHFATANSMGIISLREKRLHLSNVS